MVSILTTCLAASGRFRSQISHLEFCGECGVAYLSPLPSDIQVLSSLVIPPIVSAYLDIAGQELLNLLGNPASQSRS